MSGDVMTAPAVEGHRVRIEQLEAERASASAQMADQALASVAEAAEAFRHLGAHGRLAAGIKGRLARFGAQLVDELRSIEALRIREAGR